MERDIILIVDDDEDILEFLSYNLKKANYIVYTASNGADALEIIEKKSASLILLDVMMPQIDGIELCQMIRKDFRMNEVIIAFLTSRAEDYSQIAALEAGADDYITKPIRPRLLIKKIESLLRRKALNSTIDFAEDQLQIDRDKFQVKVNNEVYVLPKKEFELLDLLASKPGKVFKRHQIMSMVWGDETIVGERTIDVHIRKLREKLGNAYIRTVKGVGYTFNES